MTTLLVGLGASQCVNAIVFRVPAVTFHPMPFDSVRCGGLDEVLPKIGILHRLLVRRLPTVALPIVDPLGDSVANVVAVRVEGDAAGPLQRLEGLDRCKELHLVIGGKRLTAHQFPFLVTHAQQGRPAAGTGITAASAVGKNLDFGQFLQATSSRGSLNTMRSGV